MYSSYVWLCYFHLYLASFTLHNLKGLLFYSLLQKVCCKIDKVNGALHVIGKAVEEIWEELGTCVVVIACIIIMYFHSESLNSANLRKSVVYS
jgi:hypothetical protein